MVSDIRHSSSFKFVDLNLRGMIILHYVMIGKIYFFW